MLRLIALILAALVCISSVNAQYKTKNVAIFVYDGVDILDIGAPGEILSSIMVSDENKYVSKAFNVYLVSLDNKDCRGKDFFTIQPSYTIYDCPEPDIVILPGGKIEPLLDNNKLIKWLRNASDKSDKIMGIGTGIYALASSGIMDGKQAVIWDYDADTFNKKFPEIEIVPHRHYIDSNNIITVVGSANSIDATLHLVSSITGYASAITAARHINYLPWLETSAKLNSK